MNMSYFLILKMRSGVSLHNNLSDITYLSSSFSFEWRSYDEGVNEGINEGIVGVEEISDDRGCCVRGGGFAGGMF